MKKKIIYFELCRGIFFIVNFTGVLPFMKALFGTFSLLLPILPLMGLQNMCGGQRERERERAFHLFSYFLFILVAFPPKFFSNFWMQIVLSFGEMPFYFQMVPLLFLLLIFFSFPFCLTHCFFSFKWVRKGNRSLYFW